MISPLHVGDGTPTREFVRPHRQSLFIFLPVAVQPRQRRPAHGDIPGADYRVTHNVVSQGLTFHRFCIVVARHLSNVERWGLR